MNARENYLRTIEFRNPEWIPCAVHLASGTSQMHRERLEELVLSHPRLFPAFRPGSVNYDNLGPVYTPGHFRDNWGCLWHTIIPGIEGRVVESPLADWSALDHYRPPDPRTQWERGPRDWDQVCREIAEQQRRGELTWGNGERLFDRLYFLRGFDNLMRDIARDDPHLPRLIELLLDYETRLVKLYLELKVDLFYFHTDIGTQTSLMISPAKFRWYIKPMFKELFQLCRRGGAHVFLSSDGVLLSILDDLIECGVSAHDPQFRAVTLDRIERAYKGRLCTIVDLDRQMFAFATPGDIDRHVREVVERLYTPQGGLILSATFDDALSPLENIAAMCDAMERYCLKTAGK